MGFVNTVIVRVKLFPKEEKYKIKIREMRRRREMGSALVGAKGSGWSRLRHK